jgi:acyl-CoA synthetase (AMP-forming)/AMP-acid ligase II/heme oxygenase
MSAAVHDDLIDTLLGHDGIGIEAGESRWAFAELRAQVETFSAHLRENKVRVLATLMDNGAPWIVADLAALQAGVVHLPLPGFFTPQQIGHALQAAGADALLALPQAAPAFAPARAEPIEVAGEPFAWLRLPGRAVAMPAGTVKLTFTSGTTGTPKGVCLGRESIGRVANGLAQALAPLAIARHLSALPFAVLLENVAGVLAPLSQGATCIAPPLASLGLTGASGFDPARFHATVMATQPHSLILLPQMLRAWAAWLQATGARAPASLKIVAVGGAAVGATLIAAAQAVGIPACEGYGLSEGSSVQTLNLPGAQRPGSAGRALPHARLRVAADGEIEVAGSLFLGYLGDSTPAPDWWRSGDLGEIDADGYLHVRGRRKQVLITAFGRNVSPEWVETALRSEPEIAQAVVFGEAQPALSAVLWPIRPDLPDAALQAAVGRANATLPDYARIARWCRATAAFNADTGLATANGRPQRAAIEQRHAPALGLVASDDFGEPMNEAPFFQQLVRETAAARGAMVTAPIIQGCLQGRVSLPSYVAFLTEAYHHVRHTVPLLKACKAALPPQHAQWLDAAMDEYIEEEAGHDEWILADIAACGADADAVRHGPPGHATEVMVAYAYNLIARGNPLGFFGMVHVLEGTSVALALQAADQIQAHLQLPDRAFSYLRSHGTLDQQHTAHFAELMNQIDAPADRAAIVHAARAFYRLYGDVFRGLPLPQTEEALA